MNNPEKPDAAGQNESLKGPSQPVRKRHHFVDLPPEEQQRQLREADPSLRYRMILEVADGRGLVQALAAQDLLLTIKELGRDEVPELVAMASAEQLTAFVDLDCWRKDRIDAPEALQWLALAMTESEDKVLQSAQEIDFELLVLIMSKFARVLRGPEAFLDEDNPPDQSKCIGSYELDMRQARYARLVASMLDCLYRLDPTFFARLMEALRCEMPFALEEHAFQARCERLQDLGFVDAAQAGAVYAWIDPDTFDAQAYQRYPGLAEQEPAPAFAMQLMRGRDLLGEVLAAGPGAVAGWDLAYLANKLLVADGIDFGDREQVRSAMEKLHGYLNLALEHVCHGDVQQAVRLFDETYLLPLFRLGFSLTLQLQRRMRRLFQSTLGPWLDGDWAAAAEQLGRHRPRFPLVLQEPPGEGGRPFRDTTDLCRVREWLAGVEATRRLFEEHAPFDLPAPDRLDLSGCQPEQTQAVGLRHFFLTALANRLLGRSFDPVPLPAAELAVLHRRICRDGALAETLREETRTLLHALDAGAWPFVESCLQCWQESLCPLQADRLDARFVEGLLIRVA